MLVWAVVVASIVLSVPFVYLAVAKPEIRSLAFRNVVRRPGQTVLVLAGVVIATAVVTSAGVVGNSLRASVRRSTVTQLGPVDEEVLTTGLTSGHVTASTIAASAVGHQIGTLPILTLATTVVGDDFVARVAQAQIVEVNFAQASQFGDNPAATGISGPQPSGDQAVISADLSAALSILPGHKVSVEAYGTSRTFVINRVLPRLGLAGLAPVTETTGSNSLNLFVPAGTIASMAAAGRGVTGQAQPVSVLAISNGPHRPYSGAQSALVSARLRAVTAGLGVQVQPVKQLLIDDADARSSRFTRLFSAFGFFSVLGGLLLLVLTFLILTRDRARSMGVLRANGLRRSRHVAALALEGWTYAVAGAVVGGLVGLGIADLVVILARGVFATQTAGEVDLVFAANTASVAVGCAIGFVASLAVVVSAAVVASRRNIVRMIKGLPDPPRELPPAVRRPLGVGLGAAGIVTFAVGLGASNGVAAVAGPALAAIGAVLVAEPARVRVVTSVATAVVFVWSALALTVVHGAFTGLGVAVVVTEGAVMSACAVAFMSVNHAAITRRGAEPRPRRGLSLSIGLAYARTAHRRTVLIVGMYAVALFTLTLLVTVGQLYSHDVDALAGRLGGAAALEVTSDATRPVPTGDVAQLPGVTAVTATSAINAQLQDRTSNAPTAVTVVGYDTSFVGHGSPPIVGADSDAVFGVVERDPTKIIVGADLHADLQSGLPGPAVHVGDTVEVRDPLTGISRTVTVAGLVDQARWAGADHIFASRTFVDELSAGTAPTNLLYVNTAPGTNNDVTAAVIDGTHLPNGAYARSFQHLARDTLSAQSEFLDIGAAYATVGLVADLAGIAVLMVDRIRERRRQIAMLRAIGFGGLTVRRAFRVEATVIATEGIVIGFVTGLVLAWRLGRSGGLGRHLSFSLPVEALIAILVAVVLASLAATSLPARRAGHLQPAAGLRNDE
ncbi:MAG: FtsX-like permease family protein [Acidimicrobiia bacterium]